MIRLEFWVDPLLAPPPVTAWGFAGTSEGNGSTLSAAGKGRGKNDEMMMQDAIMSSRMHQTYKICIHCIQTNANYKDDDWLKPHKT